jgi:hypothetical protein
MVDFSSALLSSVGFPCVGVAALPLLDVEFVGLMAASDGGKVFDGAATDWLDEPELSDTGFGRSVFDVFWHAARASASIAQTTSALLFLVFICTSQEMFTSHRCRMNLSFRLFIRPEVLRAN